MKINGITFDGPKPVTLVVPVGGQEIVLTIKPVFDFEEFHKIFPCPEPPGAIDNQGNKIKDFEHPSYLSALDRWSEAHSGYLFIKALEDTDIEWDKVDITKPETYELFDDEFRTIGLSPAYLNRIKFKILDVCGTNADRIDEATERFLAGRAQVQKH